MPSIGDMYRFVLKGRLISLVETRNMFTYALTSANGTDADIASAWNTWVGNFLDHLKPLLANSWTSYEFESQKWHPAVGGAAGYWQTYSITAMVKLGTAAGDITGYQPAILVVLKTLGKKIMGRKFLAGLAEAETTNGALIAGALTTMATCLTDLLANISFGAGGSMEPGVKGKDDNFYPFIGGTIGSIVSSMRRRKPGYGI